LHLTPSALCLEHLDAARVMDFLAHLEAERGHSARTRNARLAAIKAFMKFVAYRVPSSLEDSRRILAMPTKKTALPLVHHLSMAEMHAILEAPDVGVAVQFVLKPTISMTKKINELGLYKRTFPNKINPFLRFWSFPCLLLP
jgi:site-specific recombinase XerD